MGTKRALAQPVVEALDESPPGPLLDVFAGMCSVGYAARAGRSIWNNDLQLFACSVASAFFCASQLPIGHDVAAELVHRSYQRHEARLRDTYAMDLAAEASALETASVDLISAHHNHLADTNAACQRSTCDDRSLLHHFPYSLFTERYAGSYLGLSQTIEIDSLRFSLDHLRRIDRLDDEQHQWMLLALAKAMSRCSTSTGHFAQPLAVKSSNAKRFCSQRRRSVFREWLSAVATLSPLGDARWRAGNRVFRSDSISLLDQIAASQTKPAVVYADPPYTNDQYSRYYHLYETLLLYDYPTVSGTGRYRPDRAVSSFSLKAQVKSALPQLIEAVARTGADLVLSYPTNGLFANSREELPRILSSHFRHVAEPLELEHDHSTMGASKGEARSTVTEVIYKAVA